MSTLKRGNNWYIDFRFNRVRFRKRSPENSKAGAQVYEATLRQKLARGEGVESPDKQSSILFKDFTKEWFGTYVKQNNKHSEVITKNSILNATLVPFFGGMRLDQITTLTIERFKAACLKKTLTNKTVNNYLTVLSRCLKSAVEWRYLECLPMIQLLKVPPPVTNCLTSEECEKLLCAAQGTMYEMICVALHTGLRFGELIGLMWSDVDYTAKVLTVQRSFARGKLGTTKSNKIRRIPLGDRLLNLLRGKKSSSQFIFTDEIGQPLKQGSCRKKLLSLAKKAGIRPIGWHIFRHTAASFLTNQGEVIQTVQELLGHSDIRTTQRYSHLAPVTLVSAIENLEKSYSHQFRAQGGHKESLTSLPLTVASPIQVKLNG